MSNCQEKIKKPIEDEPAMAATTAENPIELSITTVVVTVGIFSSLRHMGIGQHNTLIASTLLVWLMSWYR